MGTTTEDEALVEQMKADALMIYKNWRCRGTYMSGYGDSAPVMAAAMNAYATLCLLQEQRKTPDFTIPLSHGNPSP